MSVALELSEFPVVSKGELRASYESDANTSDLGNAKRLARAHGHDLRYCFLWKKWLVYDGRRWRLDDTGEVDRRAKDVVRELYAEAAKSDEDKRRKRLAKHALATEQAQRIRAMIDLARSEDGIPVTPAELDTDRWLLNCVNGTVDLRTGEVREHRCGDYITKLCPVEYDQNAMAPVWDEVLRRVFNGDEALIGFLQRFLGYCLTGDVSEQMLPIWWGSGSNAKRSMEALAGPTTGWEVGVGEGFSCGRHGGRRRIMNYAAPPRPLASRAPLAVRSLFIWADASTGMDT